MPKKSKVRVNKYGTTNIKDFFKDMWEPTVLKVNRRIVKSVAEDAVQEVKERIENQTYNHIPLNRKYLKWKDKWGLDTRILIRTGTYVDSIKVVEIQYPRGIGYRVGFEKDAHTPLLDSKGRIVSEDGGPYLTVLSKWLEYGTRNMPARPHFMPVYRDIRTSIIAIKKKIRVGIEKELKERLEMRRGKYKKRYHNVRYGRVRRG